MIVSRGDLGDFHFCSKFKSFVHSITGSRSISMHLDIQVSAFAVPFVVIFERNEEAEIICSLQEKYRAFECSLKHGDYLPYFKGF